MGDNSSARTYPVYAIGIFLAAASLTVALLIIPPLIWHSRSRNIGASFFIGWLILLLLFNFVNAIIWGSDDITSWYDGKGLCDFEIKVQIGSQVGLPTAFACILRGLAKVMDTKRLVVASTRSQKRRTLMIDLIICIFFPLWHMLMQFVVQPNRFYVFGIAGCVPSSDGSWLAFLLIIMPQAFWLAIDAYFAVLIIIRLYRYRISFDEILASNNTTKSRFMRLYLICIIWLAASIALWSYGAWWNTQEGFASYSWSKDHDPEAWNQILQVPSDGVVLYDRWIWLVIGILIFIFFGLGREAIVAYRRALLKTGAGRLIPALNPDRSRRGQHDYARSSTSEAKAQFKHEYSAPSFPDEVITSITNPSWPDSSSSRQTSNITTLEYAPVTGIVPSVPNTSLRTDARAVQPVESTHHPPSNTSMATVNATVPRA